MTACTFRSVSTDGHKIEWEIELVAGSNPGVRRWIIHGDTDAVMEQLAPLIEDDHRSGQLEPYSWSGGSYLNPCREPRMRIRLLFARHLAGAAR